MPIQPKPGNEVRRFEDDDLTSVMEMHDQTNFDRIFSAVRSRETWQRQIQHPGAPWPSEDREGFTVVESRGQIVAYVRLGTSQWEGCVLIESGCKNGNDGALLAALPRLLQRCKQLGYGELRIVAPADHPISGPLTEMNVKREFSEVGGLMLNVVSPLELFIGIEELLSRR